MRTLNNRINFNLLFIPALVATVLLLSGCQTTNSLSKKMRNDLAIGTVSVSIGQNSPFAKNALPSGALKRHMKNAIKARTAKFHGKSVVNLKVTVIDYYIPGAAAQILIGVAPYISSRITLIDAKTGRTIGKEGSFNITVQDFDGGNWALKSPIATKFDTKYPSMIGLYARKLTLWLGNKKS